ncbi:MAG: AI-2E family transporter [Acidobacteriota bacterium]
MPPETLESQTESPDEAPQGSIARALGIRNGPLTGLFLLAAFYTLYAARSFLLPVVLAGLLTLLLEPVVRFLKRRLRIPAPLGAGIVLFALLGGLGFAVYQLAQPAYDWMGKAPQSMRRVERRLRDLKKPVQTLGKATEQVEKITQVGSATSQNVTVNQPSLGIRLANQATEIAAGALVMFILVFFLLASGDLFLRKLIRVLPTMASKRQGAEIVRALQGEVSRYLMTVTFINVGLGASTGLAMWWIGLPNPVLWGVVVAIANYIPYLGAGVCYVLFGLLGFLTFEPLAQALLPIGAFLVLNVTEAYIVSPLVLGRRLTLNPVVIFLSLTFWTWLWGVAGAILAVPITAVLKILCDRIAPLASIGEFLGE